MTSMPVAGMTSTSGAAEPAELLVRNAKVYTGDRARLEARGIAVRDGRVLALGDDHDLAGLVGPGTKVVDALGRRVVPGLDDSHLHVIRGGLNY